jgi:hypothetical protein
MSYISVKGGTKKQRELVESMAYYCVDMLGMSKLRTLDIEVKLTKLTSAIGYCLSYDTRNFELEIAKQSSLRRMLETVAHEMVHVKQYARKELVDQDMDGVCFLGKKINPDVEYWDKPYEIEAHGREVGLFIRWAQDNGYADKDWAQDPL